MKAALVRTPLVLLALLPALAAAPLGRAGEAGPVLQERDGLCELAVPSSDVWRLTPSGQASFSLEMPGGALTAAPAGSGACENAVSLVDGRLEIRAVPNRLRRVEHSASRLLIVFEPAAGAGLTWEQTYRLGVDDKLLVAVLKPVPINSEVVVDKDGTITFTGAGAVKVVGLTPAEAAAHLRDLLDKNYLVNPEVSVIVKEYASQFVFVGGEVRTPGKQPLQGGTTLKEVLAGAGGFTENAGDEIIITRELRVGSEPERVVFPRREIERERTDMPLRPGDTITVAERAYFYITGQVQRANKYPWEDGITLMQAITMAGGLGEWANKKDIRLLRTADGQLQTLNLDLRDIEKGKAADVPVKPGDTIFIPKRLL